TQTIEHYPELHDYRVVQFGSEYVVLNRTKHGKYIVHQKPVFHGGPGATLEMRIFCRDGLLRQLERAGFECNVRADNAPQWGIIHKVPWSLPILARKKAT